MDIKDLYLYHTLQPRYCTKCLTLMKTMLCSKAGGITLAQRGKHEIVKIGTRNICLTVKGP